MIVHIATERPGQSSASAFLRKMREELFPNKRYFTYNKNAPKNIFDPAIWDKYFMLIVNI